MTFPSHYWAVVLGGSSGFGLASAQKLAEHGMNCFLVHRDRRGAMARPSGRSSPVSSKTMTPLHSRLQPCSGWAIRICAASRFRLSAPGQRGW